MAKQTKSLTNTFRAKSKISRPGVHSKKGSSSLKTSRNYVKRSVGQG